MADEGVGKRASAAGGRHERETADAAGPEPWGTPLFSPPPWDLDAPIASPPFHARRFPPETSTNLVGLQIGAEIATDGVSLTLSVSHVRWSQGWNSRCVQKRLSRGNGRRVASCCVVLESCQSGVHCSNGAHALLR